MRCIALLVSAVLLIVSCANGQSSPRLAESPTTTAATAAPPGSEATVSSSPAGTTDPDGRQDERDEMVATQIEARDISDATVLAAMRAVPRHRFVPEDFAAEAYNDHPLPIGYGQTISQPYIVALMSSFLNSSPGDRVLEIGTGSGYQAAVLAEMGLEVYTIEIVPELAARASQVLSEIGYENVTIKEADGYFGWQEAGPFDSIIVTAAPDHVPQPLVQQLAPGGQMVIPIGPVGAVQTLWMFSNDESGELLARSLGPVRFVPFTRAD